MSDKANRHRVAAATAIALGSFLITATPAIALEDFSAPVSTGTIATQAIYAGTSDSNTESIITSEGSIATTSSTSQASDSDSAEKNFSTTSASDTGDITTVTRSASDATPSNVDTSSTTTGDVSCDSASSNLANDENSESTQLDSSPTSDGASNVQPTVNAGAAKAESQESATEPSQSDSSETTSNDSGQVDTSKPQGKPHVWTQAHVEGAGWQENTQEGDVAGTTGQSKRLEGVRIELRDNEGNPIEGVSYKAHVENIGWQGWAHDGELAGTTGKSLRLEALRVKLSEKLAASYSLWYRVHVKDLGWLAWTNDGGVSGTINMGLRVEAVQFELLSKANATSETKRPAGVAAEANSGKNVLANSDIVNKTEEAIDHSNEANSIEELPQSDQAYAYKDNSGIAMKAHVQNEGWLPTQVGAGMITVGTTGKGERLEAFNLSLTGFDPEEIGADSGIQYRAHVQNEGWQSWKNDGQTAGTTGMQRRIEAVQIRLVGTISKLYDILYRVHVANFGWLDWTKNGEYAGTTGLARQAEAIMVKLVKKSSTPTETSGIAYVAPEHVSYSARVSNGTWLSSVSDGTIIGNGDQINQIRIALNSDGSPVKGSIVYQPSVRSVGWEKSSANNAAMGDASGRGIESVRVHLEGDVSRFFDVYYRVCVDKLGWLDWAGNGGEAGTRGYDYAIRGLQVKLVPKGEAAPGITTDSWYDASFKPAGPQPLNRANAAQRRVVNACHTVPSPGGGLCAAWVEDVMRACGQRYLMDNACDLYHSFCTSTDQAALKVGMIVAVSTHGHTYLGGIYGHVAIYVGDGMVMDNVGRIRTMRFSDWLSYYGDLVPVKWGWYDNTRLV